MRADRQILTNCKEIRSSGIILCWMKLHLIANKEPITSPTVETSDEAVVKESRKCLPTIR